MAFDLDDEELEKTRVEIYHLPPKRKDVKTIERGVIMRTTDFLNLCEQEVRNFTIGNLDKTDKVPEFDIYVVWYCKTLQNSKALLSTSLPDKMYYECTYNGDKEELYLDAYIKLHNKCKRVGNDE